MSNQENNRRPTEGTPEHFPRLLEDLEVGILVVGPKTEALHFNDAAMHLLGLTRDQLTGHPVFAPSWNIISEDGTPFSAEEHPATRAIATKLPVRGVVAGVLRPLQADRKWILCNAMPHLAADGTVSEVICSFIDITTQKHSEESGRAAHDVMKKQPAVPEEGDGGQPQRILEISRDTTVRQEAELMSLEREKLLHRLADRLVESQDEERRRIARDLHDNASQILTAILSRLHLVSRYSQGLDAPTRRALSESLKLAENATNFIRTFSSGMHPPVLDEKGLAAAIRWYAEGIDPRGGFRVDIESPSDLPRLSQEAERSLYRIAKASITRIRLLTEGNVVRVRLRPNSREFALEAWGARDKAPAYAFRSRENGVTDLDLGASGMSERMRRLGGSLEIISSESGILVRAVLPLGQPALSDAATPQK